MRISDWSSDVCSSELPQDVQATLLALTVRTVADALRATQPTTARVIACGGGVHNGALMDALAGAMPGCTVESSAAHGLDPDSVERSEEHTSELQSLMRISYAVFCLQKKKQQKHQHQPSEKLN